MFLFLSALLVSAETEGDWIPQFNVTSLDFTAFAFPTVSTHERGMFVAVTGSRDKIATIHERENVGGPTCSDTTPRVC